MQPVYSKQRSVCFDVILTILYMVNIRLRSSHRNDDAIIMKLWIVEQYNDDSNKRKFIIANINKSKKSE